MTREWKRVKVAEVCDLIVDCVNKTAPVVEGLTPYKMLRTTNIKGGRIDREDCRRVSKETFIKWTRRADVRLGDVILTREAPLGEVGFVDFSDPVFLGQRLMQYRANPMLLEPRFLLYSFLSKDLQNQFGAHEGSGSTVSHIRVGDCSKFELSLPPLAEQRAIASVLGALDDKIELNRRMNATLEAMARALFQSWFLNFDPVRAQLDGRPPVGLDPATAALFPASFEDSELGPIPKGWSAKPLPEAIEVNPRRTLKAGTIAPYLDMKNLPTQGHSAEEVIAREFSSGTKFQNGDTLLARITPCLENGKTGYVDFLEDGQVGWGSTEYIVLAPKPPLPPQFGYLLARSDALRTHAIQNMTGTSGRQRVPSECFNTFWLAVPPPDIAKRFDALTAPLMAKIKANADQSRTLATLRDTLLPKLLSGELSVNEPNAVAS
jgi:type I restriction enzyme S subunit